MTDTGSVQFIGLDAFDKTNFDSAQQSVLEMVTATALIEEQGNGSFDTAAVANINELIGGMRAVEGFVPLEDLQRLTTHLFNMLLATGVTAAGLILLALKNPDLGDVASVVRRYNEMQNEDVDS